MDYFFLSSIRHNPPKRLVVSYDISCMWSKKLPFRVGLYPSTLGDPFTAIEDVTYVIPKFHIAAHIRACQANYLLNFTPHVGRTDEEAPERGWAAINAVANSTKEMGPGSQRDTLDDHFGNYNWRKVCSLGMSLKISHSI